MSDDAEDADDEGADAGSRDADRSVAERVADHSVALSTTDPDGGLAALDPLREPFAHRTVVGLGEATHGSREFFEVKHRLVRFLVRELDCRAVAFETGFSAARAIDRYVTDGEGDPREALADLHVWTWTVESVLALVEWLRSFNADRSREDRVRFYGVDAQHTGAAARAVGDYLDRVDPGYRASVGDDLDTLAEGLRYWSADVDELRDNVETTADTVAELRERLADGREAYAAATSPTEQALAERHAWTLERAHELAGALAREEDGAWAVREESMAATVGWALDRSGAPVALWGHNNHLHRGEREVDGDRFPGLGALLAEEYGDDYYALGFDFDRGSFRALAGPETDREGIGEWHVDPLPAASGDAAGTVAEAFNAVDAPAAVLDFDRARADDRLAEWIDAVHERRDVGAVFREERQTAVDAPGERFDGLAFVRETTPARPLEEE